MSAEIIDLAARRRPARPVFEDPPLTIEQTPAATALCATLISRHGVERVCGGLLTYESGRWRHIAASRLGRNVCGDPEPARCGHGSCTEIDNIDQTCAHHLPFCCGCCWILEDELEGRRTWPR